MMSEELDFEAEIPVSLSTNVKIVSEVQYSTPNVVKEESVTKVISDIGEVKNDSENTNCDAGLEPDSGEVESDKGNMMSGIIKVKSDTESVKCGTKRVEPLSDTGEVESTTERVKCDTESVEPPLSDTGEVESDTGEIHSDTGEMQNDDLEEGELDEDTSIQVKPTEVVCRFYQRGTCLYGSHCRNPHVSGMVYNMFDPVLSNRSNFKSYELQNVHKPPVFQPIPMPMVPEVESSWERGIKKAKFFMQNVNLRKQSEDLDIENDWERCLEEAKANIHKASLKRKAIDTEKPYFNSKYSKQEKFKERSPITEEEYGINESSKQKYSKNYYSKYENESNYEKRTKPLDIKPTPDHLKFVDPWRRSKSPRKRTRSMSSSLSPSPSLRRFRDRSASSSSSSTYFKQIYEGSHKVKPTRKKSRSHSASPHSKKSKILKAHAYNKKRSYSKSVSRSFSKSPRKRLYSSSSSSSESSEKGYVQKKPYSKERNLKTSSSRVFEIKNDKRYTSSERPKNTSLPSATKPSFKKTCQRALSPSDSDSSNALSYLSYTSVSSLTDIDDLQTTYSEEREGKHFAKRDQVPPVKRTEETLQPHKKNMGNSQSIPGKFSRLSEEFDVHSKQKKTYHDTSKLQIPSEASTKYKPHSDKISGSQSTTSHQASKPTMAKKSTKEKHSAAAMELLMYHSFRPAGDKAKSPPLVIKSPQAKNSSLPLEATKLKNNAHSKGPVTKEVESKHTPDVQFKSQPMKLNSASNVKKEAVSKRKMLLQQLQAIEDAIARKKQPA